MAILLGAFTIQGLLPGPQMLISELEVTFSLIWSLAIDNIVGAAALLMKKGGWSRPPLVLGYILGKIMASSLHLSIQTHGVNSFTRPIVLLLIVLLVMTIDVAIRCHRKTQVGHSSIEDSESEGGGVHPLSNHLYAPFA